ncbi:MAG: DUF1501 domain-containing protein [Planctomycetaceae bacterium]|nr:DUF1501 domain-containing protein [Planctomycetaceae bacterium]MCB9952648.1 DUF1501 domain-containing protein [Planctomycetaceae bacterium]
MSFTPEELSHISTMHARRSFLQQTGIGLGRVALATLLGAAGSSVGRAHAAEAITEPNAVRPSHFPGKAKAVIHLFMAGAPSQFELFENKPLLKELEGQPLPPSIIGDQRYAFIRPDAAVLGGRFKFAKHGQSGAELSETLPNLGRIADEVCILKAVHTDQFNHAPAQIFFNTGFSQPGRPSMGSWVTYGLGAETDNLPAFVVMSTGAGLSGGATLWSSGLLPTQFTGVQFRSQGDPILNVNNPAGIDDALQADTYDLLAKLNQKRLAVVGDPEIATRMAAFEMAARLQVSAPELMDFSDETQETLDLYGCKPEEPSFARACLLARRMVERGVRFINLYHAGWDAHSNVEGNVRNNCKTTDQASAALVLDLKRRGLLDETLVIWGGEFGRTPMVESNAALGRSLGRDHHPQSFSMWMAGGGIKPGMTYGRNDDFGFHPTENDVHVQDLQATILHTLGLNHERLSIRRQGLDFRLTGVEPRRVVQEILS